MSIFAVAFLSIFLSLPVSPTQRVPSFISMQRSLLLSSIYQPPMVFPFFSFRMPTLSSMQQQKSNRDYNLSLGSLLVLPLQCWSVILVRFTSPVALQVWDGNVLKQDLQFSVSCMKGRKEKCVRTGKCRNTNVQGNYFIYMISVSYSCPVLQLLLDMF